MTARSAFVVVLLFLASLPISAQDKPKLNTRPAQDLSQEEAILQLHSTNIAFQNDGTSVEERTVRIKVQSAAGVEKYGILQLQYPQATSSLEIVYVRVQKSDGTTIETPLDSAQDMPSEISRVAPMYSDWRDKHLAVRGLAPGDTLEYQIRIHTTSPLAPGQFWYAYIFGGDSIVQDEELTVSVPAGRALLVKSNRVQPTITEANGRRTYLWKSAQLKAPAEHKDDLDWLQQHALGRLPAPDVQLTTFRSWAEVGQWFDGLMKDRTVVTPEIRAKVAELTQHAASDNDKITAIYDFVATHFRYISISFGIGRMQPHTAAEVFANGYGDCKDKHTLLATMLTAAGIDARPALINAQHQIDDSLPSPAQFDHMITFLPQKQGGLWLDSTSETAPAGVLLPPVRGKPALVIATTASRLVSTPMTSPTPPTDSFDADATLSPDGHLHGSVHWERRSDVEVTLRRVLRNLPRTKWDEVVQSVSYYTGFAGKVTDVTYSPLDDLTQPLKISYTYDREGYSAWRDGSTSPFLPHLTLPDLNKNSAGKMDIYLGEGTIVMHSKLTLPAGADLHLPPAVDLVQPFAEYHAQYSFTNNVLEATRRLTIKQPMVTADHYFDLQSFITKINDDQERSIPVGSEQAAFQLGGAVGQVANAMKDVTSTVPAAKDAFEKGLDEVRQRSFSLALNDFHHALELDPKMKGVWTAIAYTDLGMQQTEDALAAFRKEIELNPDYTPAYLSLGYSLMLLNRGEEAIAVWQQLEKAVPGNLAAPANLGQILYAKKRYAEAEAQYKIAFDGNPRSQNLAMGYGMAALKAGHTDLALATLKKVLDLNPSPEMLNDVAYELADNKVALDDALAWIQKSVQQQELETREFDIDHLRDDDLKTMTLLGPTWDSVGWIYYRRGQLPEAESWLKAAWQLTQDPTTARHLAELYTQQGNETEAKHMGRLANVAQAVLPSSDGPPRLMGRNGLPVVSPTRDDLSLTELSKSRLTKLTAFARTYDAEVFLLFAPGPKVEAVKYLDPADESPEATAALKTANYNVLFPTGSDARLLRRAVVSCGRDSGCSVTLLTPTMVKSVR